MHNISDDSQIIFRKCCIAAVRACPAEQGDRAVVPGLPGPGPCLGMGGYGEQSEVKVQAWVEGSE